MVDAAVAVIPVAMHLAAIRSGLQLALEDHAPDFGMSFKIDKNVREAAAFSVGSDGVTARAEFDAGVVCRDMDAAKSEELSDAVHTTKRIAAGRTILPATACQQTASRQSPKTASNGRDEVKPVKADIMADVRPCATSPCCRGRIAPFGNCTGVNGAKININKMKKKYSGQIRSTRLT